MTDLLDAAPARPAPAGTVRFLADVYDAASECNKCSLCQAVCPTYVTNPVEWETARGRVGLVRDAMEGRLDLRDIADGPLSTCLTCDNCVAACAPRVPTAQIVSRARQELFSQQGQPVGRSFALRAVLPRPGALRWLHHLARAAQVTGTFGLLVRSGLLGTAGALAEHAGGLPAKTGYDRIAELPQMRGEVRGRVGLLMCCYQNLAAPAATEATVRVMRANGFDVVAPQLGCSGLPAKTLGDREAMIDMASRNLERLRGIEVDAYIGDVAACTRHYQDYGDFMGADRLVGADARALSPRVWFASEFLESGGLTAALGPLRWKAAIDEPCSYPIDGAVRGAVHRLVGQIPGLELMPLHEAEMCCGGAGVYFHAEPERSAAILQRKMEHVAASGAEVLVTENISCLTQLRSGAARFAPGVRVMHVFELLDASVRAGARGRAAH